MNHKPSSINHHLSSRVYHLTSNPGFTLLEILIVVSLLVLLSTALLITLNPWTQINKGQDSKRKAELTQLGKVLEDYYNDHQCYPPPAKVCYKPTALPQPDGAGTYTCYICGRDPASPAEHLAPYLSALPCDPRHPTNEYMYQVDNQNCPTFYRVYTLLTTATKEFCTPDNSGQTQYNWGVSSPNTLIAIDCQ